MRNLLIFLSKYNAFFLFVIFGVASLIIFIKYNSFQNAAFVNSSNKVIGDAYYKADEFKGYLTLREVNDSLARENARLRNQLKTSFYIDTLNKHTVNDTIYKQQYEYVEAKVIKNSVNLRSNYITINIGSRAGVKKGQGVIADAGVVGKVIAVSEHYAIVQSLLHKQTIFSAMLADTRDLGSFSWSAESDPHLGLLYNVSNNATPKVGELVVTSDESLFPAGIVIGKLSNLRSKTDKGAFLNMDVAIAVNFSKLEYVYVITNELAKEQLGLEALEKPDE